MNLRNGLAVLLAAALLSLSGTAMAENGAEAPADYSEQQAAAPQQRANRQPTAAEMQEMMGPMMAQMMASMIKSMSQTMAEPAVAQNLATFTRNYYKALVDRGFTDEEAMKIVTSTGMPNLGGKQ